MGFRFCFAKQGGFMRKLSSYIGRYWYGYVFAVASMVTAIALDMLYPKITQKIVDDVILGGQMEILTKLLTGIVLVGIGRSIFGYCKEFTFDFLSSKIGAEMRKDLFNHIQTLSMRYFDDTNTGELMARVKDDVDKIQNALGYVGMLLIEVTIHVVFVLYCMFSLNWKMAFLPVTVMLCCAGVMRIDGNPAIGIAISTVPTGNVVDMAEAVKKRIDELSQSMPEGYELTSIYDQGYESAVANQGFVLNLIISVLTVIAILLFFIGFKNGTLIGSGLIFSIFATLIVMMACGIALQRMSLAAIIIAMGMLVDNAIVVSDSALINMERGMRKRVAIMQACSTTALPLLAATVIAILTFLPIYYSPHITGELLSSLVVVIGVSLMFSWVFALTQTPFFIQEFVRRPRPEELKAALFDGKYYNRFRNALHWVLRHRSVTIGSLAIMLILSAWSFKFIPKVFVPALEKQYFTVDMWLPEGTNINETDRMASSLADYIRGHEETEMVSTYIGRTPPRYYLSNVSFGPQSNYAQILVKCKTSKDSKELHALLQDSIRQKYPEPLIKVNKFELSPLTEAVIEARFLGPDPAVLDSLAGKAIEIMRRNPKVADARNEWGNMSLMIRPVYDPVKAGALGITKTQMMQSVKSISDGTPVGIYRDNEKKVPVLLKSEGVHITDERSLGDFSVWNGEAFCR